MKKCIVTVVGKDTVGIIAKVCTYLAESKINILDISQTIVQGYFNMMMVVDISKISSFWHWIFTPISSPTCSISSQIIRISRDEDKDHD